jgi:hypothetical protein
MSGPASPWDDERPGAYAARRGRLDEAIGWVRDALEHGIDAGSAAGR